MTGFKSGGKGSNIEPCGLKYSRSPYHVNPAVDAAVEFCLNQLSESVVWIQILLKYSMRTSSKPDRDISENSTPLPHSMKLREPDILFYEYQD
jgi:hypothetical protein